MQGFFADSSGLLLKKTIAYGDGQPACSVRWDSGFA
jgi:hypothetical protein